MIESNFVDYKPYGENTPDKNRLKEYFANNSSDSNPFMDRYLAEPEITPTNYKKPAEDKATFNLGEALAKVKYFATLNKYPEHTMANYKDIMPTKNPKDFIDRYGKLADQASKETGISKEFILAQTGLETGWGEHINMHNIGNIKPGSDWKGATQTLVTTEYDANKKRYVKIPQEFRAYNTPEEGFKDYISLLTTNSRYKGLIGVTDPMKAADIVAKAGYATDRNYAKKIKSIINIVKQYNV